VLTAPSVYARHETGFELNVMQDGFVAGSASFSVTGAAAATLPAEDRGAFYTPPVVGHYSVTGTFRKLRCADGERTTYYDVTTPPAEFDALPGERPRLTFRTARRPAVANSRGDATLVANLTCPSRGRTTDADTDLAVYYEKGTRRPTHASPHLKAHVERGCERPLASSSSARSGRRASPSS